MRRHVVDRAQSSAGSLVVAPSLEGERCTGGAEGSETTIDLAPACAAPGTINEVTADNPGTTMTLSIDDVRFVH